MKFFFDKKIIDKKFYLKSKLSFLFLLLNSVLEIISLGTIPIILNFFLKPEGMLKNYPIFNNIYPSSMAKDDIIVYGLFLVVIFFLIKNLFLVYFNYFERSFFNQIAVDIQKKIYDSYLLRDYLNTLEYNSSFIVRNFTTEVEQLRSYLRNGFLLLREAIIIFLFLIILFYLDFYLSLFLIVSFAILTYFFYIIFQKKLTSKGKIVQEFNANIIELLTYSIELIKEVKVVAKEDYLRKIFFEKVYIREKHKLYNQIISILPRILLEFFIIFLIFIVSFFIVKIMKNSDLLFIYLSFLAISAIRIIPSMNIISNCLSTFKFYSPSYNVIKKEISFHNEIKQKIYKEKIKIKEFKSINLQNVSFGYKKNNSIFKNVNFEILAGEKILIRGMSGSGKSTLINILLGLQKPTTGKILINNTNFTEQDYIFDKLVGFVPQDIYLINDTIKNNIALFDDSYDPRKMNEALKISNSKEFIDQTQNGLEELIGQKGLKISGGQRQRIAIARAIYPRPKILILDEPTSSQDAISNNKIIENLLRMKDLTIIVISHNSLNDYKFSKRINIENKKISLI
tara:strand:+ start:181 stop:1884 length:1704 start_codon:yes stop_codon:yes gene_type:complete